MLAVHTRVCAPSLVTTCPCPIHRSSWHSVRRCLPCAGVHLRVRVCGVHLQLRMQPRLCGQRDQAVPDDGMHPGAVYQQRHSALGLALVSLIHLSTPQQQNVHWQALAAGVPVACHEVTQTSHACLANNAATAKPSSSESLPLPLPLPPWSAPCNRFISASSLE